jgi:hypothetical protein
VDPEPCDSEDTPAALSAAVADVLATVASCKVSSADAVALTVSVEFFVPIGGAVEAEAIDEEGVSVLSETTIEGLMSDEALEKVAFLEVRFAPTITLPDAAVSALSSGAVAGVAAARGFVLMALEAMAGAEVKLVGASVVVVLLESLPATAVVVVAASWVDGEGVGVDFEAVCFGILLGIDREGAVAVEFESNNLMTGFINGAVPSTLARVDGLLRDSYKGS